MQRFPKRLSKQIQARWSKSPRMIEGIIAVMVCLFLTTLVQTQINGSRIQGDATYGAVSGYNVAKYGIISGQISENPEPSNYREPLPSMVNGLFIKLHPGIDLNVSAKKMLQGEYAQKLKYINLFWIYFSLLGLWTLAQKVGLRWYFTSLVVGLSFLWFYSSLYYMNSLLTEIPTATLMILTVLCIIAGVQNNRLWCWWGVGVGMGLLALTKAVFFHVGLVLILCGALAVVSFIRNRPKRKRFGEVILVALGFFMSVFPWMYRNYVHFGNFEMTQRGGVVLLIRAVKNQMSSEEVIGALYFWGPSFYQNLVGDGGLGADVDDFDAGGRFQRLNRSEFSSFAQKDKLAQNAGDSEACISFYRAARAERVLARMKYESMGMENSGHMADMELQQKAIHMILSAPMKHIGMSFPFAWRGIWCFSEFQLPFLNPQSQKYVMEILNLLAYISLICVWVVGVVRKRIEWMLFPILPLAMLGFYAAVSHNIPRYSVPAIPFMILALILVLQSVLQSCGLCFHRDKIKQSNSRLNQITL